jgi:hypothetical protein
VDGRTLASGAVAAGAVDATAAGTGDEALGGGGAETALRPPALAGPTVSSREGAEPAFAAAGGAEASPPAVRTRAPTTMPMVVRATPSAAPASSRSVRDGRTSSLRTDVVTWRALRPPGMEAVVFAASTSFSKPPS